MSEIEVKTEGQKSKTSKVAVVAAILGGSIFFPIIAVVLVSIFLDVPEAKSVGNMLLYVWYASTPLAFILGITAFFKIKHSKGNLAGLDWAKFGIAASIVSGVFLFFLYAHASMYWQDSPLWVTMCKGNLRQLGLEIQNYSDEFDGRYPIPEQWCDLLEKNSEDETKWFRKKLSCIAAVRGGDEAHCHYAMNPNCQPNSPNNVVLLFETKGGWNQFGDEELLTTENHKGTGCNILFNNGHVEFVKELELDKLKWGDGNKKIGGSMNPEFGMEEFTKFYVDTIKLQLPEAQVNIISPMEVSVTLGENKSEYICYLDNVWSLCKDAPEKRSVICNEYIGKLVEMVKSGLTDDKPPDSNTIIPILKDDRFLNSLPLQADGTKPIFAERIAGDVWVTYAQEIGGTRSFISESDIEDLDLSMSELRQRSISNLKKRLDEVRKYGQGPLYMLTAGGHYEASLLLIDKLWVDQEILVSGDIVAAIPKHNTLFFTDSESVEGITKIRQATEEFSKEGAYLISKTLLVRRNGKWEVFEN